MRTIDGFAETIVKRESQEALCSVHPLDDADRAYVDRPFTATDLCYNGAPAPSELYNE